MESLVQLRNVKKKIGKKEIIKGLTFDVYPGEVFGFLGPNGAGKTTTIRMMMGLMGITEGEILISGKSINNEYSEAIQYVGGIVENPEMYKFLTGYQNLIHFARMHKGITKQRIDEVINLVGLENRINDKVKTYSLGMRQRLGLAQALLHKPKLLILDEPTNGLDPAGIREIRDYLRKLTKEQGLAVIVSSHLLSEMEMMCDRIAIIQQGSLVEVKAINEFVSEKESDIHLFTCEPKEEAASLLKVDGIQTNVTPVGLEVTIAKQDIPKIVRTLVENDIQIYGIAPLKKSLEDRFLEVTGGHKLASLVALIQNENMKIYRRVGTWVMIGLLIIATVAGAILGSKLGEESNPNWREELTATTKQLEMDIANPDIPDMVKDRYRKDLAIYKYQLQHDIAPIERSTVWGYTIGASDLITFITLFVVVVAASSVASEFSWGTIKLLLIRPATRSKILLSKYISTILFALLLLIVLLVTSMLSGGIVYSFDNLDVPHLAYQDGKVVEISMFTHILSIYGLNSIQLIMMATFAFMISTVFRSSSLAIGLATFLMFMGGQVTFLIAQKFDWAKYILFANTDLTQYIDGVPMVEGMTMSFSIIILFIYFIVFNGLSWFIFRKRDIAA